MNIKKQNLMIKHFSSQKKKNQNYSGFQQQDNQHIVGTRVQIVFSDNIFMGGFAFKQQYSCLKNAVSLNASLVWV